LGNGLGQRGRRGSEVKKSTKTNKQGGEQGKKWKRTRGHPGIEKNTRREKQNKATFLQRQRMVRKIIGGKGTGKSWIRGISSSIGITENQRKKAKFACSVARL